MLVALLSVVSFYFMKPAHFGGLSSIPGVALFVLAALLCLGQAARYGLSRDFSKVVPQAMLWVVLWFFLYAHAIYNNVINNYAFNAFILSFISAIAAVAILSVDDFHKKILKYFIVSLTIFGYSAIITLLLATIIPINSLMMANYPIPPYTSGGIYFPFTIEYGTKHYPWATWIRASAGWREAGIAQCIYAWALLIVMVNRDFPKRVIVLIGLWGGALATQSTTGYVSFAFVTVVYALFFRRGSATQVIASVLILAPLAVGLGYIAYFDESIGFAAKMDSTSFTDRSFAIENSLNEFMENPFGDGVYSTGHRVFLGDGINLIGSIKQFGIIGAILILANWIGNVAFSGQKLLKFCACVPIYFTMLSSQPMLDGVGIFIILMLDPAILNRSRYSKMRE